MIVLDLLLVILSLGLLALVGMLALEIFCSLLSIKKISIQPRPHAHIALLIPAHNEEKGIEKTLQGLKSQLTDASRLIVIADNCTDQTAALAQASGAEVLIREDLHNRGKGFALSFGIDHLKQKPPEIVIIVDADCMVHQGAIEALVNIVQKTGRSAQSRYLMDNTDTSSLSQKVARFAFLLKNHIRLLGLKRMGLPCHLVGTGMAFPWDIIKDVKLASGNIVEDMQLGIDLAKAGKPAIYCPEALVTSSFPENQDAVKTQRTRWEHGHLQTITSQVPGLIKSAFKTHSISKLLFAMDLAIPPLTLLILTLFVSLCFSSLWALLTSHTLPLKINLISFLLLTFSLLTSWYVYGRYILAGRDLFATLLYIFKKIPIYINYIVKREKNWIRTDRE